MATIRVHELAKDMNLSSKDLLDKLQELGLNMKNHMSTIPSAEVNRIKSMVLNLEKNRNNTGSPVQPAKTKGPEQRPALPAEGQKTKEPERSTGPVKPNPFQQQTKKDNKPNQFKNNQKQGQDKSFNQQNRPQKNNQGQGHQGQFTPNNKAQQKPGGAHQGNKKGPNTQTLRYNEPVLTENVFDEEDTLLNKVERAVGEKAYERGGKTKAPARKVSKFDDKKTDHKKGPKTFGKDRNRFRQNVKEPAPVVVKHITLDGPITVQEFAHLLNKKAADVIKKLLNLGVLATINQELDVETLILLGAEFGTTVEVKASKEEILFAEEPDKPEELEERPPVVTIMGHVDHGKTSLLDVIRHTNVTASEAGGITQHIGAYQVEINGRKITFLDTPGHEAFTAMRARGAQVTDIAVLVVAADDGVMPQTVEAINHAQAANVPIIVAINKIDKEDANPERVKQELTEYGLVPEEWGGETICVNVSAHTKVGLENLLEMILLVAEVRELKANPNRKAKGTVVEAKLDKGRGPVATVLVQNGTLEVGDFIIAGTTQGRIRAMQDDKGRRLKKAPPSTPVEIIGLSEVPQAGDIFLAVDDERLAKQITSERSALKREEAIQSRGRVSLDDLFARIQQGEVRELNIIIKADVQGSIEAIKQSLEKLSNNEVRVNIIHQGVGGITETDVMLASASNAIIIGFNVRPDANARKTAESQQIDIRLYRVIYNAIEDVKAAMSGLLKPEIREVVLGRAEVRATFRVPKVGVIAGCYVTEGKIARNAQVRVIRNGIVVHEGEIDSLKRFKDDAKEVNAGYECGIGLARFNDIHEGDQLEAFTFEEIKRELS
ncbi:translation initiation factor IF-2 [Thermanaerosceptrum fracticalcis]|jgi:translation initiation factor IF-2|uniref:Translation initiation factor IF-2 n=1 Tax=Thermanaerosceptrum fracticalcis TaxID=1712410 RepID=A0A7G6E0X0_THEFR|nr:translation initiation factor IF-2 [Thermanaerosceptrum fracticalcis]QNB45724.1 translation initiation factor IF-2 [Thermanaerosceptrum fracticalcis]